MTVTLFELAAHRLGREPETGADFIEAKLPIYGGCENCGATVAAYNACPSKTGFIRCTQCIGGLGWPTPEEANHAVFSEGVSG